MHVQTLPDSPERHKVWLERQGRLAFEEDGRVPAKVRNALKKAFDENPGLAWTVRARWVRQMIEKGWLRLEVRGSVARLLAYPGTAHEFVREIDLTRHAGPGRYASAADVKLDPETAALVLDARRAEDEWVLINLADELWVAR